MNIICIKCQKTKPLNEFSINKTKQNGHNSCCKECHRDYSKQHYKNNKPKYILKATKQRKAQYDSNKTSVNNYKSQYGCKYCGEKDARCLDFHHPQKNKSYNVSHRLHMYRWDTLLLEIKKCEVVCANCHRKLHNS